MPGISVGDFGFISDCQSAALVGRDGSVDWYCPERFDSPAVFARLLDEEGGHWSIRPAGNYEVERAYLDDTMVLRTEFRTEEGRVALTDALALGGGERGHDIGKRVPHVLLRRVEGIEGKVEMALEFYPRLEYALTVPQVSATETGVVARGGPTELHLLTDRSLDVGDSGATARFEVRAGEAADFAVAYRRAAFGEQGDPELDVSEELENTAEGWRSWAGIHTGYEGLYADRVRRSALVLQALTYAPTGAVAAAATTSLPESLGGSLNWDYRFAWLRDLSLTLRALWVAACPDEVERFFRWIDGAMGGHLSEQDHVQIMYGVEGERDLTEHSLEHLNGFRGSRPVRVGNDAWKQKQLDVTGEVVYAVHLLRDQLGEEFDGPTARLVSTLADRAAKSWWEPDAGMWEARDAERHYLTSKVMCWVALDRAVQLAPRLGEHAGAQRVRGWEEARDEVREAILERGWSEEAGAYTGAFGSDQLDASVLMMPLVDFLSAADPRMWATIEAVERELTKDGLVHRWDGDENGFLLCGYWLVECLARAGEAERATELFERTTAHANDLGLLSEMADAKSGEPLGKTSRKRSRTSGSSTPPRPCPGRGRGPPWIPRPNKTSSRETIGRRENMAGRLQDKVALITGSDSGIGQATAIEFAKEGADVVVNYLEDKDGAEQTREKVEAAGRRAIVVRADVSDEDQVGGMFDEALEEFGTIDVLMNNAGVDASGTEIADLPTEVWDKAIKTNLYGYFFCCRRFINVRKGAGGGGKIINVTSVHQEVSRPTGGDYDTTKGAIRSLTRTLALELAPHGINVNNLGPGMVLTPFNQGAIDDPDVLKEQVQSIPMKRAAQPEEIGRLAVFLASSDADYVTGSTYFMDGGLMRNMGQGA